MSIFGRTALDILGYKYKYIRGHRGGKKVQGAIMRGEGNTLSANIYAPLFAPMVKLGELEIFAYANLKTPTGEWMIDKELRSEGVKSLLERLQERGIKMQGNQWKLFELFVDIYSSMTHGLYAPPGVPKVVAAELSQAFYTAIIGEAFKRSWLKVFGAGIAPRSTVNAKVALQKMNNLDPAFVRWMKVYLK